MKRLTSGALALTVVLAAQIPNAQAQAVQPEITPEACSDHVDNDGDGFVDCMDQDCQRLPICQAPPQGSNQPPPGQYAPQQYPPVYPPPQPYMVPPPSQVPPSKGVGETIVGSVFLGMGIGLTAGGAWLWQDWVHYCGSLGNSRCGTTSSTFGTTSSRDGELGGALALLVLGPAMTIVGAIFLPVGIVKMAKYGKWKREHNMANLHFEPIIAATPHSGALGLKLTF